MSFNAITATSIRYTSAAGETRIMPARGTFWYLTTGNNVVITVWDNTRNKLVDAVTLVAGRGIKFPPGYPPGYQVQIYSAAAQTVQLDVIDGEIIDNSFIISSASAIAITPSGTTLTSATAAVSCGAAATTLISAGAANIRQRWIRNDHATDPVYIRANTATAQSAMKLVAGAIMLVENQSTLYAYNPGAGAINVYVDTETTT